MTDLLLWLVGALAVIFFWGLVSPRSQWYVLVGWSRDDPRASEPGSAAYSATRILSLVGLIVVGSVIGGWAIANIRVPQPDVPTRAETLAEKVWGAPRPLVVDRVFLPSTVVPTDLVEQKVTGYQLVSPSEHLPKYLFDSGRLRSTGLAAEPGFLGVDPLPGTVALEMADIVIHVRGDDRCIPQRVVAIPVEGAIQLGVFFGQQNPSDGSNTANLNNCDPGPPIGRTRGYLIPIDFAVPLGATVLQHLDGSPIELVPPPRE